MNIVAQRQLSAAKWVKSTAANLGSRAGLAHCKWVSLAPSGAGYSRNSTSRHLGGASRRALGKQTATKCNSWQRGIMTRVSAFSRQQKLLHYEILSAYQ